MRYYPENKYELKELENLKAQEWQIDLLKLNPDYCSWGPYEDYMSGNGKTGWDQPQIFESWSEFGPWKLDDLNEIVNFYFELNRENKNCYYCDGSGYSTKAKQIADDWYDFNKTGKRWCDNITQDEVQALIDHNRLYDFTHTWTKNNGWIKRSDNYTPTAEEINKWSKKGIGHDAINRMICIEARCKRLNIELYCNKCNGNGYIYTKDNAYVSLILWVIHPRKGCSRGIEIKNIKKSEIETVQSFLKEASERNSNRFSKL